MDKIRIALVEDLKIVRVGLVSMLSSVDSFEVVGDFERAGEFLKVLNKLTPDIVVVDIQMPGMSGVDLIKIVKKESPQTKTLILSESYDEAIVFHAVKSGINGFVHKNISKDELIAALITISKGGEYYSGPVKDIIMQNYLKSAKEGIVEGENHELSSREREVLKYLALGKSIVETSEILCVSYSTIVAHKSAIKQKLGFNSDIDMVRYAIKNNIVPL